MDFKKLEKELYDIANNLVGNTALEADADYFKSRWHAFAFFCIQRRSPDYLEIVDVWTKWIRAYCDFKKLHTPEAARLFENPGLTVCWLRKPVVEFGFELSLVQDSGFTTRLPGPEDFSFAYIKAYLGIYRTDCEPHETVTICPRCKEMDKALGGDRDGATS